MALSLEKLPTSSGFERLLGYISVDVTCPPTRGHWRRQTIRVIKMSAKRNTKSETSRRVSLLIDAHEVARRLGQNERTVRRLIAAGTLPKAIVIDGTSKRWRPDDIKAWVAAGCPDHSILESARHQSATAGGWYSKCERGSGSNP